MTPEEARRFGIGEMAERKRHVQLVVVKGNHLPPEAFVPLWLRRGDHGLLQPAELDAAPGYSGDEIGERERAALRVLLTLCHENAGGSMALEVWRKRAISTGAIRGATEEAKSKAMARAVRTLVKDGAVCKPEGSRGRYLPEPEAERVCEGT